MLKKIFIIVVGLGLLIGCTRMSGKKAYVIKMPEVAKGATYVGTKTCLECHEDYAKDRHNVHMRVASFEAPGHHIGCEGCHGPGSLHVDGGGDTTKILRFGKGGLEPEEVAGVCISCHKSGALMDWTGSAHAENDVSCLKCHKIHFNEGKNLLINTNEFELCGQCHQDIKAKGYLTSHHPVREGKMKCTDCHEPHGTSNMLPGMIKAEERKNDLCLRCHARYQGPFVFEHDPVVEDCTICHDPHGTVANNLLVQNEPFLCLQCHEGHFHALRNSNPAGTYTYPPGVVDPYTGSTPKRTVEAHSWQRAFMTKCTTCHQYVHGSDLPSQTVSGQGKALTR